MTAINDPERLLRSLAERQPDDAALAGARERLDDLIQSGQSEQNVAPSRSTPRPHRRVLVLAAAAAAVTAVVAVVATQAGEVDNPGPQAEPDYGAVVAAGPDGFVVPATAPEDCTPTSGEVSVEEAVDGGVGYLLSDLQAGFLTTRMDEACEESAGIAAAYAQIEDDGTLTGALTVWGPDAVDPNPWLHGDATVTEVDVGAATAELTAYGENAEAPVVRVGVQVLSWTDEHGSWVITSSGTSAEAMIATAEAVTAEGDAGSVQDALPDFVDMTPAEGPERPGGLDWLAGYGSPHPVDQSCSLGSGCRPQSAADMLDHLQLTVSTESLPWPVRASTRTLENPYTNTTAVYRVIDVSGTPALFNTASEVGLQGRLSWEVAPGVTAILRGTWGGAIEGIIPFAEQLEPVQAGDPRIPTAAPTDG